MCWYVQRQNKLYKSWDDVDRLKWGIRWKDGKMEMKVKN